ncbi:MAG: Hsp20/alpha crystallin family protein, partial [Planctomycetaceae bacterium]|nr:Hsp20/alpha crystallin family protein [Planctomycetaceae bacterium]
KFDGGFPWNNEGNGTVLRKVAPLSMWSDGNAVFIDMDVPGIVLADLDVSVENGKLTIHGQRKAAERSSEYLHEERFFGEFERTVVLNEWVDPSSIEATLRDGVLHLKLSKKAEAQRQKVAINYCDGSDAQQVETSK